MSLLVAIWHPSALFGWSGDAPGEPDRGDRMKSNYRMCGREAVGRVRFASMNMKIRRLRGFLLGSVAALLLLCGSTTAAQTFRGAGLGPRTGAAGPHGGRRQS